MLVLTALSGCVAQVDDPEAAELAAARHTPPTSTPRRIQSGAGLVPLGVTADHHAIYRDAAGVFATALRPGATPQLIANLPAGGTPWVKISGEVAFVWPDAGAGVSPLVAWSARGGAHQVTAASIVQLAATEASSDGGRIVFLGNVSPGGATGDLMAAGTDLGDAVVLAAGLDLAACPPSAGFAGGDGDDAAGDRDDGAHPVAAYCRPGEALANLAIWRDAGPVVLVESLLAPYVTESRDGQSLYTLTVEPTTGARAAVIASADGATRIVDRGSIGSGFWAGDALVYAARTATGRELRRADPDAAQGVPVASAFASFAAFTFGIRDSAVSLDDARLPFVTAFDPATGIADQQLLDVRAPAVTTVEPAQQTLLCNYGTAPTSARPIPFTRDGRAFVYSRAVDPNTFLSPLAAFDERGARTFSDELGLSCAPATDSLVVFNDHTAPGYAAADLRVVDLAADVLAPRTIWPQAAISFVVTEDGREVVFASGPGDAAPGLYAAALAGSCRD